METTIYKAYGRPDENGNIIQWLNDCFNKEEIQETDIFHEEYTGGHYHKSVKDENGLYCYNVKDGEIVETTDDERSAMAEIAQAKSALAATDSNISRQLEDVIGVLTSTQKGKLPETLIAALEDKQTKRAAYISML